MDLLLFALGFVVVVVFFFFFCFFYSFNVDLHSVISISKAMTGSNLKLNREKYMNKLEIQGVVLWKRMLQRS
jgi:hypothetical protein